MQNSFTLLSDASGGPVVETLEDATLVKGSIFTYIKTDSTRNSVTLTPILGQTINGESS